MGKEKSDRVKQNIILLEAKLQLYEKSCQKFLVRRECKKKYGKNLYGLIFKFSYKFEYTDNS